VVTSTPASPVQDPLPLDARARRTRESLGAAVIRLARERPLHSLSVTDLTGAAGISRPTFYLHYASPDELFADLLRSRITAAVGPGSTVQDIEELDRRGPEALTALLQEVEENRPLYRSLIGAGSRLEATREALQEWVTRQLSRLVTQLSPLDEESSERAALLGFLAGGTVTVLGQWLSDDAATRPGPEQLAVRLWALQRGTVSAWSTAG
jgi:AcrR family transcriptional regulator